MHKPTRRDRLADQRRDGEGVDALLRHPAVEKWIEQEDKRLVETVIHTTSDGLAEAAAQLRFFRGFIKGLNDTVARGQRAIKQLEGMTDE